MRGKELYVPGLPTVISDPLCTGMGTHMTHVVTCYVTKPEFKFTGYRPNTRDYPQFEYIIQLYIDNVLNKENENVKKETTL